MIRQSTKRTANPNPSKASADFREPLRAMTTTRFSRRDLQSEIFLIALAFTADIDSFRRYSDDKSGAFQ
jgi:hypothetical protein